MTRRRVLLCLLIGLGLAVGADALWWRVAEQRLAAGLAAELATARAAGWTLTTAAAQAGGWPLAATLSIADVSLAGGGAELAGGIGWSTDRLLLGLTLWQPNLLSIDSEGMQRLRVGSLAEIPYTADSLHVTVPLDPGVPPRRFRLHMSNLRAGVPAPAASGAAPEAPAAGLTIHTLQVQAGWTPAAQQDEAAVTVSVVAGEVRLPPGPVWPLGPAIDRLSADLALDGPLPRVKGAAVERALAWRDAGGTLQVQRLILRWGALALTGSATLALDGQLQPMGAGTCRITDPLAALEALHSNGALSERAAFAARAVLSLMLHMPGDGAPSWVELPFTLQDRLVSMNRYGLFRLPQVSLDLIRPTHGLPRRRPMKKASTSFLKKRSKKLLSYRSSFLSTGTERVERRELRWNKSFLLLFFKKEVLSCLLPCVTFARSRGPLFPPSPVCAIQRAQELQCFIPCSKDFARLDTGPASRGLTCSTGACRAGAAQSSKIPGYHVFLAGCCSP